MKKFVCRPAAPGGGMHAQQHGCASQNGQVTGGKTKPGDGRETDIFRCASWNTTSSLHRYYGIDYSMTRNCSITPIYRTVFRCTVLRPWRCVSTMALKMESAARWYIVLLRFDTMDNRPHNVFAVGRLLDALCHWRSERLDCTVGVDCIGVRFDGSNIHGWRDHMGSWPYNASFSAVLCFGQWRCWCFLLPATTGYRGTLDKCCLAPLNPLCSHPTHSFAVSIYCSTNYNILDRVLLFHSLLCNMRSMFDWTAVSHTTFRWFVTFLLCVWKIEMLSSRHTIKTSSRRNMDFIESHM